MKPSSAIIALLLLIEFGAACGPTGTGLVLSVDGKEFSDARILIDGESVGRFSPRSAAELGIETRLPSGTRVTYADEDYFAMSHYISISPGRHQIVFETESKRRLEIDVNVEPGENYASYSLSSKILR
jgi:hypothetical protein